MSDRKPRDWKSYLREYHHKLRTGIIIRNFLPAFRKHMTDYEFDSCFEKENVEGVDELVKILLTKDETIYLDFCSVLEENGYGHWAAKLRGKGTVSYLGTRVLL